MIITKVEAFGYRCLREVRQELGPYQILVGPNGSGKSVFLDVIAFLGDLASRGLAEAVSDRTENFFDLVWGRKDGSFHLAIEAEQPQTDDQNESRSSSTVRYEIEASIDANSGEMAISNEELTGKDGFGNPLEKIGRRPKHGPVLRSTARERWYDLHPNRSIFTTIAPVLVGEPGNPTAVLLNVLLGDGVKMVSLDSSVLRRPSPQIRGRSTVYDGSNLARLVAQIQKSPQAFQSWLRHVKTAIPDIADIRTIPRPEEGSLYLMIQYTGGVEVPQWMVSDGTLRLLALTVLAYLPDFHRVYLIEEPEVGVHPTAIETIMQSLSSVYEGQVLVTSHSPIVLSLARPDQLLCFQKSEDGTKIIPGNEHPMLREWKAGVNVSDLFAAGVLG